MSEPTSDADLRAVAHRAIGLCGMWRRDEVGIGRGSAIVDILATDDHHTYGYELKSARDTLCRLPMQVAVYETAIDFITLVCAPRHVEAAERMIPRHWGIVMVRRCADDSLDYDPLRRAKLNPNVHAQGLFSLIWRDELLLELERLGIAKGARGAKRKLQARYLEHCTLDDLRRLVCRRLVLRDWNRNATNPRATEAEAGGGL